MQLKKGDLIKCICPFGNGGKQFYKGEIYTVDVCINEFRCLVKGHDKEVSSDNFVLIESKPNIITFNVPEGYTRVFLSDEKIVFSKKHEPGEVLEDDEFVYIFFEEVTASKVRVYDKKKFTFSLIEKTSVKENARELSYKERYNILRDIYLKTGWVIIGSGLYKQPGDKELCLCFNSAKDYTLTFYNEHDLFETDYNFVVSISDAIEYSNILYSIKKYFPDFKDYADSGRQE